jgi:Protein of unknown function (DUF1344)
MRAFVFSTTAFAFLAAASLALAATDIGRVKSVNSKGDAITLDDGKVFVLAEGTEAESVKVGSKVKVTFSLKSGKLIATKVQPEQ